MDFLGNLGIDSNLLIAQIINFGLLLWLLKKFLYKPIVKRIEKDEKELMAASMERKKLEKEQSFFAEQKEREFAQARAAAERIITEAEAVAKNIRERSMKEAEKEKQRTIKQIHERLAELEHYENEQ